jgi:hypothetical protein
MATPPLNTDQVRTLLAAEANPNPDEVLRVLRYLFQAQLDLEGRARQLKSAVGRMGK